MKGEPFMQKYVLYGDGIHDDTNAIQELIDHSGCELSLPVPQENYLISRPLEIPSNFKLKLPRYAKIRLADGSNCFMLKNKTVYKPAKRSRDNVHPTEREMWRYLDLLSPDAEDTCHDFEIEGGIWDFNNLHQDENPVYTRKFDERNFLGHGMFFYNVKNFRMSNLTLKDPTNYAVLIDLASYFTVENITFDFNFGNPIASNMDGIHLNGSCHHAVLRNLKGACYDDLVALNSHEGSGGDITNIEIDGIFAENCHSAVRFLPGNQMVKNVHISNVYGTYYQYCIGFTKFPKDSTGGVDSVVLDNIHASKSKRLPIQEVHMGKWARYHFPLIVVENGLAVKHLCIEHLHRREYENPTDTIHVAKDATVDSLIIRDFTLENHTDSHCAFLVNHGTIKSLRIEGADADDIENNGVIENMIYQ